MHLVLHMHGCPGTAYTRLLQQMNRPKRSQRKLDVCYVFTLWFSLSQSRMRRPSTCKAASFFSTEKQENPFYAYASQLA